MIHPAITQTAQNLGMNAEHLDILINFETGGTYNPAIKNPNSSARGLIQFIDSTARSLGYKDSADLVAKNPTIESQMKVVEQYLRPMKPFPTLQSLAMAIFYPAYRNVPITQTFPDNVLKVNPSIYSPLDYINKMTNFYKSKNSILSTENAKANIPLIILIVGAVLWMMKR